MPRGFKVADIYAELNLDKDVLRQGLRDLPGTMGADADRAGQELGRKMTDGLARAVEASSARLTKARRSEQTATEGVKLAEVRLSEAREKGGQKASTLLALEQKLEQANRRLADAQSNTVTSTKKLEDAQRRLASSMGDLDKSLGPRAQKSGEDAGGKLALGMRMSVIRNSPLIVAAIAGGLAAGGPLLMTAATGLFAGIGIVAAAQSDKVQKAWSDTWGHISRETIKSAAVIEPTLIKVADNVGASFDRMRPRVADAFEAANPQIEVFADGILRLAENALPGLVRAVERGMPVTQGFANFLAKTGTGVSDFFDRISDHGPAAGRVWSSLGDTMATLLPTLGEVIGQGAELAADVLPLVNTGLGLLLKVVNLLGPALPAVAAGIAAMKIAGAVSGGMATLATKLGEVAASGGAFSGVAGKAAGGLGAIAGAAGPAAAGIGFLAVAVSSWMELGEKAAEVNLRLGQAIHVGGSQAQAAAKYFDMGESISKWVPDAIENIDLFGHSIEDMLPSAKNARDEFDKWFDSLGASGQAQAEVSLRTQDLDLQIRKYGAGSEEAETAGRNLAAAQAEAARAADDLKRATEGVTQALADQANQARARVDSHFALSEAANAVEDAEDRLNQMRKEGTHSSEELERASLDLAQAFMRQVYAAGEVAKSDLPASMSDQQKAIIGAKAELDLLNNAMAHGIELDPDMELYRRHLEAITGQANGATLAQAQLASAVTELGFAVEAVPGEKKITITAPTDALRARLGELGFTIRELPNGDIEVTADTAEAEGNVGQLSDLLVGLDTTTATATVDADTEPLKGKASAAMSLLDMLSGKKPIPITDLDANPLVGKTQASFNLLDVLGGKRPVPVADVNTVPLNRNWASAMNVLSMLSGQRPMPIASLNAGPFSANANWMSGQMGWLNGMQANPWATLHASTGTAEWQLNQAARNRVSYVTQIVSTVARTVGGFLSGIGGGASGGPVADIVARGFAGGGSPARRSDGRISGPGGPLDDMVPAITDMGEPIRVANTEWIVNAMASARQGDRKMAALNAGLADIVMRPPPVRGFADGGAPNPVTGTGQVNERPSVTIQGGVTLQIPGAFNLGTASDRRRLIREIRDGLVELERSEN